MNIKEIIISRTIKACYMGFIMSRKCNDYLGKRYQIKEDDIFEFIKAFNCNTDFQFNKISIEKNESKWSNSFSIRTLRENVLLSKENAIQEFYDKIEELINLNLKLAISKGKCIQVFDLNTFDELDRTTWNTMGDKYVASNNKRYTVSFIHLYNIGDN